MMKKAGILILFFVIALLPSLEAKEAFRLKTYSDYSKKELLNMLAKAKTDTEKITLLNSLAFGIAENVNDPEKIDTTYILRLIKINNSAKLIDDGPYRTLLLALKSGRLKNYTEELSLFKRAIEELDQGNIDAGNILIIMRWVFNVANKQEDKFPYYSKKLSFYLLAGQNFNAAACYHCLAGYYAYKGDSNTAINNYMKAGELFKPYGNFWYINEFLVAGARYGEWGNSDKALYYLKKGFKLEIASGTSGDERFALLSLAQVEYDSKHYTESMLYLDSLNSFVIKSKADSGSMTYKNILTALNDIALNRLPDAWLALQNAKKKGNISDINRAARVGQYDPEYGFYKYYLAINELSAAGKYLLKAYQNAISISNTGDRLKYLKELVQFYGNQNKLQDAWKYTVLYNRTNDSLQDKTNAFKIASYENEQKENAQHKKLIDLQQQRAIQDATINQRNIIIAISLAGLILVCGSLIFIYRQLRINKRNLINLRQTQRQLIQSEKMASLGELTAGIAHEIQNPLNFVNNFSEVSIEMLNEMTLELKTGNQEEAISIADDIEQNLEKIIHHGKRADGIVKGMLQHSRATSNTKEPTDINVLADEYLRLAYHGLRAKNKDFNADLVTNFDEKLPLVDVVPQDVGRVLLNLLTNAFYAVQQKQKSLGATYKPVIEVNTSATKEFVEIGVKDNGNGIAENVKDKIMQPFFTTKPTGEGTGLGLSMSYDIVVKGHGGNIAVETKEGEFTRFIITIPR